jgi:hypothetical protein
MFLFMSHKEQGQTPLIQKRHRFNISNDIFILLENDLFPYTLEFTCLCVCVRTRVCVFCVQNRPQGLTHASQALNFHTPSKV